MALLLPIVAGNEIEAWDDCLVASVARVRTRIRVRGTVQGVGFRPFVYGAATRLRLAGFVLNDSAGVVIEAEGAPASVDELIRIVREEPPPLAVVEDLTAAETPPLGEEGFEIRASEAGGEVLAAVSPDMATCAECLAEIMDPSARRHRYAFTNCTNCGPRFTITTAVPYDRPNTTMAGFAMCEECRAEYENPLDRRFHAQPIACPLCGPRLSLLDRDLKPVEGDAIDNAARLLLEGAIVAIKGLGGYHLACDASNETAVAELRLRKAREEKPFAVMAPTLEWVCRLAETSPEETGVIGSRRRPIVLVRKSEAAVSGELVAPSVAPGNRFLGIMLPYTPLHHLLMRAVGGPIVLTSGNTSDEPIAFLDEDARVRLAALADYFLTHDRPIHIRCDDSVVRVVDGAEYPIRRSRGYAPEPLTVVRPFARPVLGAGAELKHTFCLGRGNHAILSHHIGDLENYEAMTAFTDGVRHLMEVFDITPEIVAHDLHPEYLSTKWALGLADVAKVGVQHHHAHIASCLADNGRDENVIGLALDGTGYGDDGAIWGCEVLACDLAGYKRLAHLAYVPLPGGAAAVREPWRMAAVYLDAAFGPAARDLSVGFVERTRDMWPPILKMAETGLNAPLASSAGRLFDAAAALCGLRDKVSYEGQAAAELEQVADPTVSAAYPCRLVDGTIDGAGLIGALAHDLAAGRAVPEAAAAFHGGLAKALVTVCELAREDHGLEVVALSGGTFQNLLLLERVTSGLLAGGFQVLRHRRVPPNDGGISLGQAAVAAARLTN